MPVAHVGKVCCRLAPRFLAMLLIGFLASPIIYTQQSIAQGESTTEAYDLYAKGDFAGAIQAAKRDRSEWIDYQLFFNSYMALYLKEESVDIKDSALLIARQYRSSKKIDDISDPGPMYIVLKEDSLAEEWYREMLARANAGTNDKSEKNSTEAIQSRAARISYGSRAIKLITEKDWVTLPMHDKLERLLAIAQQAVKSAGRPDS